MGGAISSSVSSPDWHTPATSMCSACAVPPCVAGSDDPAEAGVLLLAFCPSSTVCHCWPVSSHQ